MFNGNFNGGLLGQSLPFDIQNPIGMRQPNMPLPMPNQQLPNGLLGSGLLGDMLAQAPNPNMLGSGQAQKAGTALNSRQAYLKYTEEAQMNGQKPLPYDQWIKMQTQGG